MASAPERDPLHTLHLCGEDNRSILEQEDWQGVSQKKLFPCLVSSSASGKHQYSSKFSFSIFIFLFFIKKKCYLKQKVQLELVRRKHSSYAGAEKLVQDILCVEQCNRTCTRCSACLPARTHCVVALFFSDSVWVNSGAGGWSSKTAAILSLETGKYQHATRPAYITWAKHAHFSSSVCFSSKG